MCCALEVSEVWVPPRGTERRGLVHKPAGRASHLVAEELWKVGLRPRCVSSKVLVTGRADVAGAVCQVAGL